MYTDGRSHKQNQQLSRSCSLAEIDWQQLAEAYRAKSFRVKEAAKQYQISGVPQYPDNLKLRDYQQEAVANWLQNKGRGTLQMATGSGKTIIALAIATELYQKIGLQVLIVVCPYQHLVLQWQRESQKFGLEPVLVMNRAAQWQGELASQLCNVMAGKQKFLTLVATNSSFISEAFQSQVKFFPEKTLIVGDEAHNLGSATRESSLPRNLGLRLALSATPQRYYDEAGTAAIFDYFGQIIQPLFTLQDAIDRGALVPYSYYPIFVELTEAESFIYAQLTKKISWTIKENDSWEDNPQLTALLAKRSRVVATANNKLTALKDLMETRLNTSHTLFYCGDGEVEYHPEYTRQIAAVTRILGKELGYKVNTYTAETPIDQREKLRKQLDKGILQGLVAIRCLDEGVDIPAIRTAVILASSSNPRQFIQRRGRILRPHPGKTTATLFDMVVIPPRLDRAHWEIEKKLLDKELNRLIEFAELAQNAAEARDKLLSLELEH